MHCGAHQHQELAFSMFRHMLIPCFGLLANFGCMLAYIVFPFIGIGTKKEPLLALGIAAVWGIYGGIYFTMAGKAQGKTALMREKVPTA